ncbi:MAG: hypothetical protein ACXWPJ_04705 [Candidatus Limnocylindrales bacterium]
MIGRVHDALGRPSGPRVFLGGVLIAVATFGLLASPPPPRFERGLDVATFLVTVAYWLVVLGVAVAVLGGGRAAVPVGVVLLAVPFVGVLVDIFLVWPYVAVPPAVEAMPFGLRVGLLGLVALGTALSWVLPPDVEGAAMLVAAGGALIALALAGRRMWRTGEPRSALVALLPLVLAAAWATTVAWAAEVGGDSLVLEQAGAAAALGLGAAAATWLAVLALAVITLRARAAARGDARQQPEGSPGLDIEHGRFEEALARAARTHPGPPVDPSG